jgi:hypothetical protein
MFRFFQPAYPLIYLAVILSAKELSVHLRAGPLLSLRWWRANLFRGLTVGAVIAYWLFTYSSDFSWSSMRWSSPIAYEFRIAEGGMANGRNMNHIFVATRPLPNIGVISAGGIARTYTGPITDLMGLNNSLIAHFKGDRKGVKNHAAFEREVFFNVEPDILLASPPVPPETNNCFTVWLKGLMDDPQFTGRWRYGILSRKDDSEYLQRAFVKKDFLEQLPSNSGVEFRDTMIWSNKWLEVTVFPGRQN